MRLSARVAVLACVSWSSFSWAATAEEALAALKQLPGLASIAAGQLVPEGQAFKVPVPNSPLNLWVFQGSGNSWHGAMLPAAKGPLAADQLWPRAASEVFGDGSVVPVGAIVSSAEATVDVKQFPGALKAALAGFADGSSLPLKQGTNGFLEVTPGTKGALAQVKRGIGFGAGTVRVTGSLGPQFAQRLLKDASAGGEGAPGEAQAWSMTVQFPASTPALFPPGERDAFSLTFQRTTLSVSGQGEALSLSGAQKLEVRVLGSTTLLDGTMTFEKRGADWSIACDASAEAPRGLFGLELKGFAVKRLTVGGNLEVEKADATKKSKVAGLGLSVGAVARVGRNDVQGDFVVEFAAGKLTELSLKLRALEGGGIPLDELGLAALPGAKDFSFFELGVGVAPATREAFLFGDLKWVSKDLRAQAAVLLGGKKSSTVAVFFQAQGLSVRKLSPQVPASVDVVPLDNALVIVSSGTLSSQSKAMFPSPVRAMLDAVTGVTDGKVQFSDGLTVLTQFSPGGDLKAAMQQLGLGEQPMVAAGAIGGVFRGDPSLSFYADLPNLPLPQDKRPGFLKFRSVSPQFFINARDLRSTPTLDVGLDLSTGVLLGPDELTFRLKTYTSLSALGAGIKVTGMMEGQWNNPLGLNRFSLADLTLGFGLNADSSVDLLMSGKLGFDGKAYQASLGLSILAAGGAPKRLALYFEAPELSVPAQLKMAEAFVLSAATGPLSGAITDPKVKRNLEQGNQPGSLFDRGNKELPLDLLRLKDVKLLFATPGASNPEVPELSGAGVGARATIILDGRNLGSGSSFVTDSEGLRVKGNVNAFSFGEALSMRDVKLDVSVPMGGLTPPAFLLRGAAQVLTTKGDLDVLLNKDKARFGVGLQWEGLGAARLSAETIGGNILRPEDFAIDVECSPEAMRGFTKKLGPAFDGLLADAGKGNAAALADAKKRRDDEKAAWEAAKKAAAANRKDATSALRDAQKSVDKWKQRNDDVKDDIKSTKKKLKAAEKDLKLDKAAEHGLKLAALRLKKEGISAGYKAAKAALKEVKKLTNAVPVDLYPEVVAARAEYDAALAEVATLEASGQATQDLAALSKAAQQATSVITIKKLALRAGRLREASKGATQAFAVTVRVALPNRPAFTLEDELAINLMDPAKTDLTALASDIQDALVAIADEEEMEGLKLE